MKTFTVVITILIGLINSYGQRIDIVNAFDSGHPNYSGYNEITTDNSGTEHLVIVTEVNQFYGINRILKDIGKYDINYTMNSIAK